ncbi:MAG: T9SS type A sorting domain-containing protein [Chitinophagales bacterium]
MTSKSIDYNDYLKGFAFIFILLAFNNFLNAGDCTKRYIDPIFKEVQYTAAQKYGPYKKNTDGTHTWLIYDVYEPKNDTLSLRPVIILIHGGSFTNFPPIDRKSPDIGGMAKALAERGYVVISPDYRLFRGEQTFEKMAETIFAASLDIDELFCYLKNDVENGNQHKIDLNNLFFGGSSAGAILALNYGLFIDDINDLDFNPVYKNIMLKVAAFDGITDVNSILHHKMCGILPKGYLSISGALIDSNIIKPKIASVYQLHGKMDLALPYTTGYPLGNPALPKLIGPGIFIDKFRAAGITVEADIYDDKFHVPVILPFGDNIPLAIELLLKTGDIYDRPVLDSTIYRISHFCYDLMGKPSEHDCDSTLLFNKKNVLTNQLNLYPNPSNGIFNIEMPKSLSNKANDIAIYDSNGKLVLSTQTSLESNLKIDISTISKGTYWMILKSTDINIKDIYLQKIAIL